MMNASFTDRLPAHSSALAGYPLTVLEARVKMELVPADILPSGWYRDEGQVNIYQYLPHTSHLMNHCHS